MKGVHVECLPDETLLRKLGITKKQITHHSGKSRVFAELSISQGQIAVVDEDPYSVKCNYERKLRFVAEKFGIRAFEDKSGNRVLVLTGKLEDWIIEICKQAKIDLKKNFNLPGRPNDLHAVINDRLGNFEKLLDHLIEKNHPAMRCLKEWLQL